MINDKLTEKLLKLYRLAIRGEGGEKTNAVTLLNKLLDKHNLTLADIDSKLVQKRYYSYTTLINRTLIEQIIYKVTNVEQFRFRTDIKQIRAKVTNYQHVQILELIDFHIHNFKKEKEKFLKDFTNAYIEKHQLFGQSDDEDYDILDGEEIKRIEAIMNNLSDVFYQKKLG